MSFVCPDCSTTIPGTNCAHSLSRAEGWKGVAGCVSMCSCKYPVRAKEVRGRIFGGATDADQASTANRWIYCEDPSGGGHVYFGTYSRCVRGNGYTAALMDANGSLKVFSRYASASA
ncbi:hypothetical protein DIPPA_35953 [Diplonema papillatum]|nr:hypothetical protein DIPPA_35953 [Diplonema papillatum]